jgi:hypothetical protein
MRLKEAIHLESQYIGATKNISIADFSVVAVIKNTVFHTEGKKQLMGQELILLIRGYTLLNKYVHRIWEEILHKKPELILEIEKTISEKNDENKNSLIASSGDPSESESVNLPDCLNPLSVVPPKNPSFMFK